LAWEEALGQLQQERATLEGARATLKEQEDEVSRLNGELVETCVSLADTRQSLEEQGATNLGLQQAAEDARQALEAERKQVEGKFSYAPFRSLIWLSSLVCLWGPAPNFLSLVRGFQA
jgi:septal ring factor EnvC (AmiA/AmiB activator)